MRWLYDDRSAWWVAAAMAASLGCSGTAAEDPVAGFAETCTELALADFRFDFGEVFLGDRVTRLVKASGGCDRRRVLVSRVAPPFGTDVPPEGLEIPPNAGSISIPFWFEPTYDYDASTEVWIILETAHGMTTSSLRLAGSGAIPSLDCAPESIAFGVAGAGATRRSRAECHNPHGIPTEIQLAPLEGHSSDFSATILDEDDLPTERREVPPGGTAWIDVIFRPSGEGAKSSVVPIRRVGLRDELLAEIWVEGISSVNPIVLEPEDCLDFGYVEPGGSSSWAWSLRNVGTAASTVRGASVVGEEQHHFRLQSLFPLEIQEDELAFLGIWFVPQDTGWHEATVVFDTDDGPLRGCARGFGGPLWFD